MAAVRAFGQPRRQLLHRGVGREAWGGAVVRGEQSGRHGRRRGVAEPLPPQISPNLVSSPRVTFGPHSAAAHLRQQRLRRQKLLFPPCRFPVRLAAAPPRRLVGPRRCLEASAHQAARGTNVRLPDALPFALHNRREGQQRRECGRVPRRSRARASAALEPTRRRHLYREPAARVMAAALGRHRGRAAALRASLPPSPR